ncbi:MAG: (d)CMP kinase [Elusimicrobiota bacterium]
MKKKKFVIAIDGPAGAGKSTIAKIVARHLGYVYIDTGAMYRAVTLKALREKIGLDDEKALTSLAKNTDIVLRSASGGLKVILDRRDVSKDIRKENVTRHTNTVAAIYGVRKVLRNMQRNMGRYGGIVMEGRDIGTCVFQDAEFKFYLDATPRERARRRYKELLLKNQRVSLNQIARAIARRDEMDRTRGINPLKQAADAVRIDSTNMTLTEVADFILKKIEKSA